MYTTDVLRLFSALIEDYERQNVPELLARAISLLSNRPATPDPTYASEARDLIDRAEALARHNAYNLMSRKDQEFLELTQFGPTLPGKLADLIVRGIPEAKARGIPSGEIGYFASLLDQNLHKLRMFRDIARDLPLKTYEPQPDEISYSVVISDRSYSGDLTELSKVFELFDRFAAAVREAAVPEEAKPRVLLLDNGSAIAIMAGTIYVVYSIVQMYSAVVMAARKTADILRAMGALKTAGVDGGFSQEQVAQFSEKFLQETISQQLAIIAEETKRPISEDLRSRLTVTSTLLMERVRQGSKITVNTVSQRELETLVGNDDVSDSEEAQPKQIEKEVSVPDLIAMSRELEGVVDMIVAESEPRRQIEGPPAEGPVDV
ncbi:hypothetical protein BOSE62_71325 [Bosea sp. 62]|uniref:hypothetical protein n=1 Tax=unclassified Bosea (in: a-proteobacteria) TaxID=2653178 RepID=UPI00125C6181|nr:MULTISPECIES: hypothetical protein [unclassified Bosea (in: a-proteobacteria)]CAD5295067.1 hypothetical protein BOSE21B_90305 [Bosea sp. 21B]CAD5295484.1 hypothetical protein BOSE46_80398 [Bosea sp. 46]CAD5298355.1 hypothetical protein BOSE7B_60360 [Bosea sp. 7B]VVT60950.1 hypothetical protein BOS5A_230227 [Bosea sp. EC-HK365B]VXB35095.1 hypothetical protein BOSE127_110359 [Bosea sp. 127]